MFVACYGKVAHRKSKPEKRLRLQKKIASD